MFTTKEVYPYLRSKGYSALESLLVCLVMITESGYSKGWRPVLNKDGSPKLGPDGKPMPSVANSWNYGAVTALPGQPFFYYPDGSSEGTGFFKFRVYPDMLSGFMATVNRVLTPDTREALRSGSLTAGFAAMRKNTYYQTMENVNSHARALVHRMLALRGQQDGTPPDVIQKTIRLTGDPTLLKFAPIGRLWVAAYDEGASGARWAAPTSLDLVQAYRLLASTLPPKAGRWVAFHDGLGWTPWLQHQLVHGKDRPLKYSEQALLAAKTHD